MVQFPHMSVLDECDLLRRERIRKFREQLGFFEHDDSSVPIGIK
jgi:hypothetical protein